MHDKIVSINGLTKRFGEIVALDNINFDLYKGDVVGLVGGNGAGKTTLLRLLSGLYKPTEGTILFHKRNGSIAPANEMRGRFGVVPEATGLYHRLTAWENIRYHSRLHGVNDEVAWNRASKFATALNFEGSLSRHTRGFSKGMRQKTALLRALVHGPEILLLDEPMNGLDPVAQAAFREMIRLRADEGATVVISSHRLNELERFVDRVAIMHHGRIITRGSFSSIEHDLGVGHRLLISGLGPNPKERLDENPLIEVEDSEGEPDWTLKLTRHDQSWSTDLRAGLVDRIRKEGARLTLMEIVPSNLEEILAAATGSKRDLTLQEESE